HTGRLTADLSRTHAAARGPRTCHLPARPELLAWEPDMKRLARGSCSPMKGFAARRGRRSTARTASSLLVTLSHCSLGVKLGARSTIKTSHCSLRKGWPLLAWRSGCSPSMETLHRERLLAHSSARHRNNLMLAHSDEEITARRAWSRRASSRELATCLLAWRGERVAATHGSLLAPFRCSAGGKAHRGRRSLIPSGARRSPLKEFPMLAARLHEERFAARCPPTWSSVLACEEDPVLADLGSSARRALGRSCSTSFTLVLAKFPLRASIHAVMVSQHMLMIQDDGADMGGDRVLWRSMHHGVGFTYLRI
ncbi:hypothetical protein Dimus_024915, partial [Dionaea muscipula]